MKIASFEGWKVSLRHENGFVIEKGFGSNTGLFLLFDPTGLIRYSSKSLGNLLRRFKKEYQSCPT